MQGGGSELGETTRPDSGAARSELGRPDAAKAEVAKADGGKVEPSSESLLQVTADEAGRFFEMSGEIMCIVGRLGRILRLNPAFERILGHSHHDIQGRPFIDFIHPEHTKATELHLAELDDSPSSVCFENRVRTNEGRHRWIAWTCQSQADGSVYAMGRDITEHKQAEAESQERESRIRFLYQVTSQSNADFIASLEEVLDFSAAMLESDFAMLGRIEHDHYIVEACAGSGVYLPTGHRLPLDETYCQAVWESSAIQVVHDVAHSELADAHAYRVMRLGSYIGIPLFISGKLYGTVAFYGQARAVPFEEGDLDFVQLIARWVVAGLDRRAIENQLEQQRRELDSLVDAVPDALVFSDTDRRIRLTNSAFTRLFGFDNEEVHGHTSAMIYPSFGEYAALGTRRFGPSADAEDRKNSRAGPRSYRQRYQRADGSIFPSETSASVVRDSDGEPIGYVGVIRDITEQEVWRTELEQKAEALERSNQELERFVYVASHDLKAPVRAIGQLVAWIEEDADGELNSDVRGHIAKIVQRVDRMEALLTGLLDYARAGSASQCIEAVDMRSLLEDIVAMLSMAHSCSIKVSGALPAIVTSRIAVEQVFTNLISNAIKHHDCEVPKVELYAQQLDGGWEFVVEDDGPGIPDADRERVFEIFKTLKSRDVFESSGVGLAIVRKVVESLGGRLTLSTASGGRGCRFAVWLPTPGSERLVA